jgi:hypothetical protein
MNASMLQSVYDAVILGAGASGLYCAMTAAGRGKSVLLIDHAPKPGRKLSITGGGKCNLSNRTITPDDYVGENPDFCRSALSRFTPAHLAAFAGSAGIRLEEREHGQLFCARSAKDVVNALLDRCKSSGCALALEEKILAVSALPDEAALPGADTLPNLGVPRFLVRTSAAGYRARSIVVATGGPAWPQVGATGTGYEIARAFGHRIVPIRPALCGLVMPQDWPLSGLAGIALPSTIRVIPRARPSQGKNASLLRDPAAIRLALLFTHTGISGPAALQASLYWRKGDALAIDFLPEAATESIIAAPGAGKSLCRNILRGHLPERLCQALLPEALGAKKASEMTRLERALLADLVHHHQVIPSGNEGFAKAEVTAGGVSTEDISSRSMESSRAPGLFFCGEVLDVTGRLGGYNLHWAFASGKAAGESL